MGRVENGRKRRAEMLAYFLGIAEIQGAALAGRIVGLDMYGVAHGLSPYSTLLSSM
jgi:hypothetical protein